MIALPAALRRRRARTRSRRRRTATSTRRARSSARSSSATASTIRSSSSRGTASSARAGWRRTSRGASAVLERVPRRARRRERRRHRVRLAHHHALPRLQPVRHDRLRRHAARVGLDHPARAGDDRRSSSGIAGATAARGCATARRRRIDDGSSSRGLVARHRRRTSTERWPLAVRRRRRCSSRSSPRGSSRASCTIRGSTTSTQLGSKGSQKSGGAGEWSNKAEKVFGGKMNIAGALMLADTPEQVAAREGADPRERRARSARAGSSPRSPPSTISCPGTPPSSRRSSRCSSASAIGSRQRVLFDMTPTRSARRVEEMRPPETLHVARAEGPARAPPASLRGEERHGRHGVLREVQDDVSLSDGHNLLRIAKTTDNVELPDGTIGRRRRAARRSSPR